MLLPLVLSLLVPGAHAQASGLTRVYLDCGYCDADYIRTEVSFVEYVRDPAQAQVHVLVTDSPNGGSGTTYTAAFIGMGEFAGSSDTLRAPVPPGETNETHRVKLAQMLRLGLVRYAARSAAADGLSISYSGAPAAARPVVDPWNRWTFTVGFNSDFSGEKLRRAVALDQAVFASRVTAEKKLLLSASSSYGDSRYDLGGGSILRTVSRAWGTSALYVHSLGEHWSAGVSADGDSSTFGNVAHAWEAGPAVEFDVFPYSQSTRRQFRFLYEVENRSVRYLEETIYGRTRENLAKHTLTASLESKETWGTAFLTLEGLGYLNRPGKNKAEVTGNANIRIAEGLSFRIGGTYSRIRDQLALPAGGATAQDILLQRQELESQYSFQFATGFTYTFGSIYADVINPRFGR